MVVAAAEVASCHRDVPLLDDDHAADIDAMVVVHGTDEGLQHNDPEDDDDYHTPNDDDDTHYYFDTIVVHTHVHVVVDRLPTMDHVPMPLESIVDRLV